MLDWNLCPENSSSWFNSYLKFECNLNVINCIHICVMSIHLQHCLQLKCLIWLMLCLFKRTNESSSFQVELTINWMSLAIISAGSVIRLVCYFSKMDKKRFKSWWPSKNVLCTLEALEIVKNLYHVCLGNIIEQSTEYFSNRPTWVKYIFQNITDGVMRYNYSSTSHSCLFTNLSECLCWLYCLCLFIFSPWFLC